MSTKPTVVQPESVPMATEPVLTVQKQHMIVDTAAVLITGLGFKLTQDQVSGAYQWIEVLWPVAYLIYTLVMNKHVGQVIRDSVWSPASVKQKVEEAIDFVHAVMPGDQAVTIATPPNSATAFGLSGTPPNTDTVPTKTATPVGTPSVPVGTFIATNTPATPPAAPSEPITATDATPTTTDAPAINSETEASDGQVVRITKTA
ncbi:MAG TPA: hypothetical protein VFQ54_01815 [Thermomicrobiales bacterium]|nr:hypothetical protein [Thermomicrobiales bacterium]